MMSKDEIEIHFPSKIPEDLKSVAGISDAMKTQIAKKVEEGSIKIQSYAQGGVSEPNEKCEMVLELLQERSKFNKCVTIDEVKEIMDDEEKYLSIFVVRFMKMAKELSLVIKKTKRLGKTAYKMT